MQGLIWEYQGKKWNGLPLKLWHGILSGILWDTLVSRMIWLGPKLGLPGSPIGSAEMPLGCIIGLSMVLANATLKNV